MPVAAPMKRNRYDEGQVIYLPIKAYGPGNAPVQPTSVFFRYVVGHLTDPLDPSTFVIDFGPFVLSVTGGTLTPAADGVTFEAYIPTDGMPGIWKGEAWTIGTGQGARKWQIEVIAADVAHVPAPPAAPTGVNPIGIYAVVTTDATPTLLVRIPIAPDGAVYLMPAGYGFARRLDGPGAGTIRSVSCFGAFRRVGTGAPAPDQGGTGGTTGSVGFFGGGDSSSLEGISGATVIAADHLDVMVTGLPGATIRWTWPSPGWQYL